MGKGGYSISTSVFERLNFREWFDIYDDMSFSRLVMHKKDELRSKEINVGVVGIEIVLEAI